MASHRMAKGSIQHNDFAKHILLCLILKTALKVNWLTFKAVFYVWSDLSAFIEYSDSAP